MEATTTMVHVRVDEKIKAQAAETLSSMGLTVSDAVRVFCPVDHSLTGDWSGHRECHIGGVSD